MIDTQVENKGVTKYIFCVLKNQHTVFFSPTNGSTTQTSRKETNVYIDVFVFVCVCAYVLGHVCAVYWCVCVFVCVHIDLSLHIVPVLQGVTISLVRNARRSGSRGWRRGDNRSVVRGIGT